MAGRWSVGVLAASLMLLTACGASAPPPQRYVAPDGVLAAGTTWSEHTSVRETQRTVTRSGAERSEDVATRVIDMNAQVVVLDADASQAHLGVQVLGLAIEEDGVRRDLVVGVGLDVRTRWGEAASGPDDLSITAAAPLDVETESVIAEALRSGGLAEARSIVAMSGGPRSVGERWPIDAARAPAPSSRPSIVVLDAADVAGTGELVSTPSVGDVACLELRARFDVARFRPDPSVLPPGSIVARAEARTEMTVTVPIATGLPPLRHGETTDVTMELTLADPPGASVSASMRTEVACERTMGPVQP